MVTEVVIAQAEFPSNVSDTCERVKVRGPLTVKLSANVIVVGLAATSTVTVASFVGFPAMVRAT